jgi:hypothetical protein
MIRNERPPNWDQIVAAFPKAATLQTIFAYGEDIYNPSGIEIPYALQKHEAVHQERQLAYPEGPAHWWDDYIENQGVRYYEELLAHIAEYKAQHPEFMPRNWRRALLKTTAERLIAPLYGYEGISLDRATRDIQKGVRL